MAHPELHPACAAFPPLSETELAADIKANGLLEPITMTKDGRVLDGRCRWDGCDSAGVEPRTVIYEGDDPIGFVLSNNKHRRHLDKSQMVMILADLMNLQPGSNQYELKSVVPLNKKGRSKTLSAPVLSKQADAPACLHKLRSHRSCQSGATYRQDGQRRPRQRARRSRSSAHHDS